MTMEPRFEESFLSLFLNIMNDPVQSCHVLESFDHNAFVMPLKCFEYDQNAYDARVKEPRQIRSLNGYLQRDVV